MTDVEEEKIDMTPARPDGEEEAVESPGLPDVKTPHHDVQYHEHTDEDVCSECSEASDYDEYEYCDCMLEQANQPIPGAPGKRGQFPFIAVFIRERSDR